jgi:hypothetical protein
MTDVAAGSGQLMKKVAFDVLVVGIEGVATRTRHADLAATGGSMEIAGSAGEPIVKMAFDIPIRGSGTEAVALAQLLPRKFRGLAHLCPSSPRLRPSDWAGTLLSATIVGRALAKRLSMPDRCTVNCGTAPPAPRPIPPERQ